MALSFDDARAYVDAFLQAPERAERCLNIHQFLGMVVAVESCPSCISDVDVGFEVLGDDSAGLDQWFDQGELRMAWVALYNELGQSLYDKAFDLAALYAVAEDERGPSRELSDWCDGYLRGYMLSQAEWDEVYEADADDKGSVKDDHLALLSLLAAFEDWPAALADNPNPERLQQSFAHMVSVANEGVAQFHGLALALEAARLGEDASEYEDEGMFADLPLVREEAKTGRNDPCPCGSGKKYKKCCLH